MYDELYKTTTHVLYEHEKMVQQRYHKGQFLGFSGSSGVKVTSKSGGREAEEKVDVRVCTVDRRVAFSMEDISSWLRASRWPDEREVLLVEAL